MAQLREGSVIKKPTGDEIIATINDIPEIPTSLPANGGDADTVGGFTVGVNVPAGAKFTDTTTTINGKTGTIAKADIVALGIPAQDTVYTHPTSHPASMITESSTKRFVSDSEKSTWNSKSDTDTVTTINGKTGAITKADIVALGIPTSDTNTTYSEITTAEIDTGTASTLRTITGRRVKYILDKVQGWIGELTKSDVGLGNVDNLSAASIRSGTTKANVGLGNVDNTSDMAKPISTATQTALNLKADKTYVNAELAKKTFSTSGASNFAGDGNEIKIAHGLGTIPTSACAFPSVNPAGFLGEVWIRIDATHIYVGNSGSFKGSMCWTALL